MNRALPAFFVLAFSAPALGQTVDSEGAKQLSENLSRYVGSQAQACTAKKLGSTLKDGRITARRDDRC